MKMRVTDSYRMTLSLPKVAKLIANNIDPQEGIMLIELIEKILGRLEKDHEFTAYALQPTRDILLDVYEQYSELVSRLVQEFSQQIVKEEQRKQTEREWFSKEGINYATGYYLKPGTRPAGLDLDLGYLSDHGTSKWVSTKR